MGTVATKERTPHWSERRGSLEVAKPTNVPSPFPSWRWVRKVGRRSTDPCGTGHRRTAQPRMLKVRKGPCVADPHTKWVGLSSLNTYTYGGSKNAITAPKNCSPGPNKAILDRKRPNQCAFQESPQSVNVLVPRSLRISICRCAHRRTPWMKSASVSRTCCFASWLLKCEFSTIGSPGGHAFPDAHLYRRIIIHPGRMPVLLRAQPYQTILACRLHV